MTESKRDVRALPSHQAQRVHVSRSCTTRLDPPERAVPLVRRSRLHDVLTEAVAESRFTLVTGPAGSGKTILTAEWARQARATGPVAWLTAHDADNRSETLWSHVQESLCAALGDSVAPVSDVVPRPSAEGFEPLSRYHDADRPIVLVLDEAHKLVDPQIWRELGLLVGAAHRHLHVVMTVRREPPLPLYRYRLEGTMAEIPAAELAFTVHEVRSLLVAHGVESSMSTATALMRRTEGWVAGIRFGALALQGSAPQVSPEECLGSWLGPRGSLVADYLEAEVLADLTWSEQELLARISLFDEVTPELAREVSGRRDAQAAMSALARRTGCLCSATGSSGGYRLHPLLKEVLTARLDAREPGRVPALRRRAAAWLASEGRLPEAIAQAAAVDDVQLAAEAVIDSAWAGALLFPTPAGRAAAQTFTADLDDDPTGRVAVVRAAAHVGMGQLAQARELVAVAERRTDPDDAAALLVIAVARTRLELANGDAGAALTAVRTARAALDCVPIPDRANRRLMTALIALDEGRARLYIGDFAGGCSALSDALVDCAEAEMVAPHLDCLALMALAETSRGRLRRGQELIHRMERLASAYDVRPLDRPVAATLAQGWAALDRQDLAGAHSCVMSTLRVGGLSSDPLLGPVSVLLRARLLRDEGDAAAARRLLAECPHGPEWIVSLADAEGRALGLAEASGSRDRASARHLSSVSRQVEGLVSQAQRRNAFGDHGAARADLLHAVTLAEPEGIRRPFRHADPDFLSVMAGDPTLAVHGGWLRPASHSSAAPPSPRPTSVAMLGQLTSRETEVLKHLAELLTTDEIAATMFISVNTVRSHVRSIIRKLSVNRRNEAIRRARELSLI